MRKISTILALGLAVGLLAAVYVGVLYFSEDVRTGTPKVEIRVNPGMYLNDVQKMLVDSGVLKHPRLFRWVAIATGKDKRVQAGRYVFLNGMSVSRMLRKLSHAEFEVTRLTVPEGFMLREIAGAVEREVEIDSARFYQAVCDSGFAKQLGISAPTLEGYLFPDTYLLSWPISSRDLARLMVGAIPGGLSGKRGEIRERRRPLDERDRRPRVDRSIRSAERIGDEPHLRRVSQSPAQRAAPRGRSDGRLRPRRRAARSSLQRSQDRFAVQYVPEQGASSGTHLQPRSRVAHRGGAAARRDATISISSRRGTEAISSRRRTRIT